jgi:hypothetical protein
MLDKIIKSDVLYGVKCTIQHIDDTSILEFIKDDWEVTIEISDEYLINAKNNKTSSHVNKNFSDCDYCIHQIRSLFDKRWEEFNTNSDNKITIEELVLLFGEYIPLDAIIILNNGANNTKECRLALYTIVNNMYNY